MATTRLGEPDRETALEQYRRAAAGYDRHMRTYARWQRMAIARLGVQPGDTVIDVACGTGLNFASLQRFVAPSGRIVGIDLSPEMLDVARERIQARGWDNVTLVEAAVEDAEIDSIGDAALFSFTHDVLQSPAAVENVVAHLRRGSTVACVGAKLPRYWNPVVSFFVRRAARRYVSTYRGLEAPWRALQSFAPSLRIKSLALGGAYVAWGEIASLPDRRGKR